MKIFRETAPVLLFCLGAIIGAGFGGPVGALIGIIIALFAIVISGGRL